MSDLKRLADDATTKAAIAVGRDAAKRAVDGLLSGGDEPRSDEARPDDATKGGKSKRWKLVALVVLGLFLVVGLIGLLLSYWYWFLAAGVVGIAGLIGYSRLKSRLAKRSLPKSEPVEERRVESSRAKSAEPHAEPALPSPEARRAELQARRTELEARARALAEADAIREQEVDEELAAMKARLKR